MSCAVVFLTGSESNTQGLPQVGINMKMQKVIEKHQIFFMNSCSYAVLTPEQLIQS